MRSPSDERGLLRRIVAGVLSVLLANIWGYPTQNWPGRY